MMTKEQFEVQDREGKKSSFARWKDEPMVRMVMAQLPPNESLDMILRAAFEAGWNSGSGHTAVSLVSSIMSADKRR